MKDLHDQHADEINQAQTSHNAAITDAVTAYSAALDKANSAYAEAMHASRERLHTAMSERMTVWRGDKPSGLIPVSLATSDRLINVYHNFTAAGTVQLPCEVTE